MKRGLIYTVVALLIAGGGWWAYKTHRSPSGPVEVGAGAPGAGSPGKGPAEGAASGRPQAGPGSGAPGGPPGAGGPGGGRGPGGPAGVEVVKVVQEAISEQASAVGALRANESVVVKPEIAGRIMSIGFADGTRVAKGTSLFKFDESVTAAERDQARAELALSEANHKRTTELAQRNFVSPAALDQALSQLKIQQAKLQLVEARLAKLDLRAPFAGVLGLRNVSVGDFVKDGAELVVLEDNSSMKVDLRLPERLVGRLKKGQELSIQIDALPGKKYAAKIDAIDVQVEPNGRSLLARARVNNPDGQLRSGMFARAQVVLDERPQALVVPEEAIVPSGNDLIVIKVDQGKAQRIKVKAGIRKDGKVELADPGTIAEGDQIVVAGQMRVQREGQEVRIIDPNRRGPPGGGAPGGGPPGAAGAPPGAAAPGALAPAGGPPSASAPLARPSGPPSPTPKTAEPAGAK
jgi:membrane fusion protein, multidrug efflux system